MKIAVLALTCEGQRLARRIASLYPGYADLYLKEGYAVEGRERSFASLSQLVWDLFKEYDGLVFVMATGIVVRVIAPLIQHKSLDPAVVVVDEAGQFTISLLSGHLGGANFLARQLGELIDATPVITTASDVQGRPAIDMVAKKLGLNIEPFSQLKYVNAAIVNRGTVGIYTDIDKTRFLKYCPELDTEGINICPLDVYPQQADSYDAVVVISDRIVLPAGKPTLYLRPRTLIVGIGCRRGMTAQEILQFIKQSCQDIGRSTGSIRALSTAWIKADEEGILQTAECLRVPVYTYTRDELQSTVERFGLAVSQYVMEQIGVGAVCEPAALLGATQGRIILARQKHNGVTLAIAEENCPWWESVPEI
jgi:cobalt-precorrin 5A hydrolase